MERALEPYVLRRLRTTRWSCYYTANSNPQRIALYPLNEQTKSILRAQDRGLFLEDWSGRLLRWIPSMEDLCFLRNGTLLLGTVSHGRICMAYPEDGELTQRFQDAICGWGEADDLEQEHIMLPET